MYLSQVSLYGFKGIKSLTLELNQNSNVLIGENRWGRSSLISALMLLSLENLTYQFNDSDFYHDDETEADTATIFFTYAENSKNELQLEHYSLLKPVTYKLNNSSTLNITYQIQAIKKGNKIETKREFVDVHGTPIDVDNESALIELLISLNPVMRLKNPIDGDSLPITNQPLSECYINELSDLLAKSSENFSTDDLHRGLVAAKSLLEYYLVSYQRRQHYKKNMPHAGPTAEDWGSLDKINGFLDELDNDYVRVTLMGVFSSIILAKGNNDLLPNAIPILILEEPESQLHPIIMSVGFRLLKNFPTQKIITTNSSDLVSLFSLESIYHLIREPAGISVKHIGENGLNASDSRRILFHILYRRSSAIFARCWLLVEGETEVWLLRELAEQSGYHLSSEGVQLIEFAQCGLRPLIKYANKMGIHWYVLTDGDIAGKKYADTVQSFCEDGDSDPCLTVLPARDIENFLFRHGFSDVYKMAAYGTTQHIDMPVSRIIQKAINKHSKPDLAIAICDDVRQRGVDAIPSLLREAFRKVVNLAKSSY